MIRRIRGAWLFCSLNALMSASMICAAQVPDESVAATSSAEATFKNGLRMIEADQIDAAIELFSGLTRDYPRLPQPFVQLAALHARKGNLQAAVTAMQAALERQTDPAALQEQLGDLYVALAARAYRSASEAQPAAPSARKKYATVQALQPALAAQ